MSTPFDTPSQPAVVPATDGQIERALKPMLAEREWRLAGALPASYIERIAIINTCILWSLNIMDDSTPAAVSRAVHERVGRGAAYGERVNAILAHLSELSDGAKLYRPFGKNDASKLIDLLSTLARIDRVELVKDATETEARATNDGAKIAEVPAGRYAVATDDGATNELAFYKVDHGKGRWAGRVFVSRLVGGHEDIRVTGKAALTILAKIAVDAEAASARYGKEIGRCGVCHTTLTNDESRARGIGPKCAAKAGW